jgi:hypothetical protein
MAITAIQINSETVAIECHQRKVQELTDLITSHSPRSRRIALGHLGNEADAEEVGWQAQTDDVAANIREDELRRRLLKKRSGLLLT